MARDRSFGGILEWAVRTHGKVESAVCAVLSVEVEKEFGFDEQPKTTGSGGRCPGETDCSYFRNAVGATPEEKAAEACTGCRMLSTKPKPQTVRRHSKGAARIADDVRGIRQSRLSGFTLGRDELTPVEYRCLLFLDSLIERAERRNAVLQRIYLEQNLQQMAQILSLTAKP